MSEPNTGQVPVPYVLRDRNIQLFLGSQMFSLAGLMLCTSTQSLLIVDMLGKQQAGTYIGWARALELIPGALLGIFVGLIIGRLDRRKVLFVTGAITIMRAVALAIISCGTIRNIPIWAILLISFLGGFTNIADGVARNAIVKDACMHRANDRIAGTYFTALYTFAMLAGNGLSGYLVTWIGYSDTFILYGVSLLILMSGLYRLDLSHVEKREPPKESMLTIAKHGIEYSTANKGILACICIGCVITVLGFGYNVILPVANKTMFNGNSEQYGRLAAIAGAGSLVGVILSILWSEKRPRIFIMLGLFFSGIGNVGLACSTTPNQGAIALFFCGFGFMGGYTPLRGALNHLADDKMLSLVLGLNFMFFYGGMIVSALGSGYIATHIGCPVAFAICGVTLIISSFLAPFIPGWKLIG